jgi:hypothetical protein
LIPVRSIADENSAEPRQAGEDNVTRRVLARFHAN